MNRLIRHFSNVLFLLLVSVYFTGCNIFETPVDKFSKLEAPIILVAKSIDGSITVCDYRNIYVTIGKEFYIATTISSTYEKGDTLVYQNIH
jgi:hypothetical protein